MQRRLDQATAIAAALLWLSNIVLPAASEARPPVKKAIKKASTTTAKSSPALHAYLGIVRTKLMHAWYPPAGCHAHVVFAARISRTGKIYWIDQLDLSAHRGANECARKALITASPLPAPPPGSGDSLDVRVAFNSTVPPSVAANVNGSSVRQNQNLLRLLHDAQGLVSAGQLDDAITKFKELLLQDPCNIVVRDQLSELYLSKAATDLSPEERSSLLHEALLLNPDSAQVRAQLDKILVASGKDPASFEQRLAAAREYLESGSIHEAIAEYTECWRLKNAPEIVGEINAAVKVWHSYAHVETWMKVVARSDTIENRISLAKAYAACGLKAKAQAELEKMLGQDSGNRAVLQALDEVKTSSATTGPQPIRRKDALLQGPVTTPGLGEPGNEIENSQSQCDSTRSTDNSLAVQIPPTGGSNSAEGKTPSPKDLQLDGAFPGLRFGGAKIRRVSVSLIPNRKPISEYYAEACEGKKDTCRWSQNRMPLLIYIANGAGVPGYRPTFPAMARKALSAWVSASEERFRYKTTTHKPSADITIWWTDKTSDLQSGGDSIGCTKTSGEIFQGATRTLKAEIAVLTVNRFNRRAVSDALIQQVCLHEVGHALGIHGHSRYAGDVMASHATAYNVGKTLTDRDKATIIRMYQGYPHPERD